MRIAVVRSVNGRQCVVGREVLIYASGPEIFADVLDRVAEGFSDAARSTVGVEQFGTIGNRPQGEERLNARHRFRARSVVWDKGGIPEDEGLAGYFIVREEKCLIFHDWPTNRCAKNVALKVRNVPVVEEVACIERAVAQKFVSRSMQLIRSVRRDNVDLRAGPLAVFSSVRVFNDGEFAHGVDAKKLAAEFSKCVVHLGRAGEFDSI